jgi:hypothetical protein
MSFNSIHRKALSLILSLSLVLGLFGVDTAGAFAAQSGAAPTVLYLDSGNILIADSGNYLITQHDSGKPNQHTVTVESGTPDITLQDVNIDVSGTDGGSTAGSCAFSIAVGAAVNLTLAGTNTLKSGNLRAGVEAPGDGNTPPVPAKNAFLTVTAQSSGSLTVTGGDCGAGIGGSDGSAGGSIQISGGNVFAYSVAEAAGIGGGQNGSGGSVTITGGNVTADGSDGYNGAGIGGGFGSSGGTILITGGTVNATSGLSGAGIGGGQNGSGGNITVSGGNVTATGSNGGAGIGGGQGGVGGSVSISGPNTQVTAKGQHSGKDIGSGFPESTGGSLTVGDSNTAEPLPVVTFLATGTDAQNPTAGRPQFMNCILEGTGAKDADGNDLTGIYDTNGKIELSVTMPRSAQAKIGEPVTLKATVAKFGVSNLVTFPGKVQFTVNGAPIGAPVSIAADGTAQTVWTPASGATVSLKSTYIPSDADRYARTDSPVWSYTPTAVPRSGGSSSFSPSLPSSVTEPSTGAQVDLSGAVFPAGVTGVTLSVAPEAGNASSAPGGAGSPSDPESNEVYHLVITQTGFDLIGSPYVYNIKLLDQNGNPITSFSGTVTVKIPIPAGIHGTPHVYRYEESTGTFTDLGAAVQNGFLVFHTDHFSYYVIAGTGDSIMLDTKSYSMPVGGSYQIGVKLTGAKVSFVKVTSTNDKVASAAGLKNGNVSVTGKGPGTAYIMFDVYDSKSSLLTHASVRVDVKTGIRPRGDSTRQIGVF